MGPQGPTLYAPHAAECMFLLHCTHGYLPSLHIAMLYPTTALYNVWCLGVQNIALLHHMPLPLVQ